MRHLPRILFGVAIAMGAASFPQDSVHAGSANGMAVRDAAGGVFVSTVEHVRYRKRRQLRDRLYRLGMRRHRAKRRYRVRRFGYRNGGRYFIAPSYYYRPYWRYRRFYGGERFGFYGPRYPYRF